MYINDVAQGSGPSNLNSRPSCSCQLRQKARERWDRQSTYLSIYRSVCLSVCLSAYLSVCLYLIHGYKNTYIRIYIYMYKHRSLNNFGTITLAINEGPTVARPWMRERCCVTHGSKVRSTMKDWSGYESGFQKPARQAVALCSYASVHPCHHQYGLCWQGCEVLMA